MKKTIVLIALSAISLPAMATDEVGFYGSLGGGAHRIKVDGFKDTAPTAMLLGGYSFTNKFAVEAGYTKLFNASDTVDGTAFTIGGHAWDLSTKWSYPMGQRFSPYGRLGWSYLDLAGRASENGVAIRANDYDDAFSWAVGTGIKLTRRTTLNGEYSRVQVNDGDFDRMSFNLNYRFGAQ
ncbi:MAG: porin family protein [Gammaproteobacteria bacterium]|nr:porin family protein [Gammaproteobacteria bacterium]